MAATIVFFVACSNPQGTPGEEMNMVVHFRGHDTTRPHETDIVAVNLVYGLSDTVLFDSRQISTPMEFPLLSPLFKGDLYAGLARMGAGDSVTFTVVADSFFLKTAQLPILPAFVTAGEHFFYHVKLLSHLKRTAYDSVLLVRNNARQMAESIVIQNYLLENHLNLKPNSSGLVFIPIRAGHGRLPDTGDMCQVFLEVRILGGDTLFSNYQDDPFDIEFGKAFDNEGFMEGLSLMREGSSARFLVPSVIGVGTDGYDGVDGFTTLDYTVDFVQIRPLEIVQKQRNIRAEKMKALLAKNKLEEPVKVRKYLNDNHLTMDSTASGLYIKRLTLGEGELPKAGHSVTVGYIQYSLNGKIIKSSYEDGQHFTFVLGTGAVIHGWEEAVLTMRKGEKVHLVIPSHLGYGSRKRDKYTPPYSPLIFDLELLSIN